MTDTFHTASRRVVLLGAPLALGVLNLLHTGVEPGGPYTSLLPALIGQGQVEMDIAVQLIQPVLLGGLAWALRVLAEGLRGPLITLSSGAAGSRSVA